MKGTCPHCRRRVRATVNPRSRRWFVGMHWLPPDPDDVRRPCPGRGRLTVEEETAAATPRPVEEPRPC